MMNKLVVGLGSAVVVGLMVAGVVYAVAGSAEDGRAGLGAGRWPTARAQDGRPATAGVGTWATEERVWIEGVVESADGSELVILTKAGESVDVALGQSAYWEAQGVALERGEPVRVEGFFEEPQVLTAASLTILSTGQTIVLRDASGRPMWSGGRRNAGAEPAPAL